MASSEAAGTYSASAFKGDARFFGEIGFTSDALIFTAGGIGISVPLGGLRIRAGGAGGKMVFLTHDSRPGWTICATDHAILKAPELRAAAANARQVDEIRRSGRRSTLIFGAVILLVAGSVWGLFRLKEPVVAAIAHRIPPAWEQKLGAAALEQLKAGGRFLPDRRAAEMLSPVTARLLPHIPSGRHRFRIHIVQDATVNAYALPGGDMVLHSGLILAADSPEEIAGVIAHEAAHVTLQHGVRRMIASAGLFALIQAFFGDAGGLAAVIADSGAFLLTQKYSRDYEREADDTGWGYLTAARIDPTGMIDFFEALMEKENDSNTTEGIGRIADSLHFMRTHPTTRERIDRLRTRREISPHSAADVPLDLNLPALKKEVRAAE